MNRPDPPVTCSPEIPGVSKRARAARGHVGQPYFIDGLIVSKRHVGRGQSAAGHIHAAEVSVSAWELREQKRGTGQRARVRSCGRGTGLRQPGPGAVRANRPLLGPHTRGEPPSQLAWPYHRRRAGEARDTAAPKGAEAAHRHRLAGKVESANRVTTKVIFFRRECGGAGLNSGYRNQILRYFWANFKFTI